jgi:hypothetical protein
MHQPTWKLMRDNIKNFNKASFKKPREKNNKTAVNNFFGPKSSYQIKNIFCLLHTWIHGTLGASQGYVIGGKF